MKKLLLGTAWIFWCSAAMSQAIDNRVEVKYGPASQPAASLYLPYSPEVVRQSLVNYVGQSGNSKNKKTAGFISSDNTLIAKNNNNGAAMHFLIGQKDAVSINESIIYLKLNSTSTVPGTPENVQFRMQDAKDYLDNLAISIKPFATALQLKWQQKKLEEAKATHIFLLKEKKELEDQADKIGMQMNTGNSGQYSKRIIRKKEKNDWLLSENAAALLISESDITRQTASLAPLLPR